MCVGEGVVDGWSVYIHSVAKLVQVLVALFLIFLILFFMFHIVFLFHYVFN